jgi:glycine/serine hydroxymethyltransferase
MGVKEMVQIADWIDRIIHHLGDDGVERAVADDVRAMCRNFPLYQSRLGQSADVTAGAMVNG